ncbi:MAG: hypothetical protein HUU20_21840 [Pirellulales bacterium]|nr:hypothetical protein [Pirellulales bacterium]
MSKGDAIISNKSCENVYRGNTFRGCAGALTLRCGKRCVVEGNFFFGEGKKGSGGVRIIDSDHRVFNNYFADLLGDDYRAALSLMNGDETPEDSWYFPVRHVWIGFRPLNKGDVGPSWRHR